MPPGQETLGSSWTSRICHPAIRLLKHHRGTRLSRILCKVFVRKVTSVRSQMYSEVSPAYNITPIGRIVSDAPRSRRSTTKSQPSEVKPAISTAAAVSVSTELRFLSVE